MIEVTDEFAAALKGRNIRLVYAKPGAMAPEVRVVENVTLKRSARGSFNVIGWCPVRQAVRSFSLERVARIEMADDLPRREAA